MVKRTAEKIKIILAGLSLILLSYCANQLPPGGGDVDTTPPEITSVYPSDGTINFDDDYFELDFSEYIDKRSFREAIFISPTIEGELDISWTGRSVTVEFPEGLREDFTYVVTIGTDVVDLNNKNRMAQSYTFLFSTGDKIDKRSITGKVYDKDADGVLVFAYRVSDDTTDYLKLKPDYISQVGKEGNFNLYGLAEDDYRIFAVKDQLRDLLFQQESDRIGIPFSDISLKGNDSSFTGLNFFLMSADTTKPRLVSAVMTDQRHILITTSKPVDSTIISAYNFSIIDSTDNFEYGVLYAFKGNTKPEELVVVVEEGIPFQNDLHLRADRIIDVSGNLFTDDYTRLTISERPDSSAMRIFRNFPADLRNVDFKDPVFRFFFDDAFNSEAIRSAITFTDTTGGRIPFNLKFPDDATIEIIPTGVLQAEKDYLINLDLSKFIDASGNFQDTSAAYSIRTISGLEFTGISGKVSPDSLENFLLVLSSVEKQDVSYNTKINAKSEFNFDRIESGKYRLWGYYDKNENGNYDFGYPSPLEYSERFYVYKDTLELRPRWSVTDILFEVK
jgi:hypothetical protein